VYITTNKSKSVLYVGVTNNLAFRLYHQLSVRIRKSKHFTGKYSAYYLIYFDRFENVEQAIEREKQLKRWRTAKKINLINNFNKEWKFLNDNLRGEL
jgi:putative endonuclease